MPFRDTEGVSEPFFACFRAVSRKYRQDIPLTGGIAPQVRMLGGGVSHPILLY